MSINKAWYGNWDIFYGFYFYVTPKQIKDSMIMES